jgi:hypothetical protein
MTLTFPSPEFDDAVAAVCHGSATETEMRALNGLLRSNLSARDEYLIRVELHSRLASDPDLFSQAADAAAMSTTVTNKRATMIPSWLGSSWTITHGIIKEKPVRPGRTRGCLGFLPPPPRG